MKNLLTTVAIASLLTVQSSLASVSISFGLGTMYSSTNTTTTMPLGARVNLLSLDSGTWAGLGDLNSLFSNLTNSWTPAGATLVGSITNNNDGGTPGNVAGVFNFSYSGAFTAGDELMLVVYPTLTISSTQPGLNAPGFFFRASGTNFFDGSDMAWIAPPDGFGYTLGAYTADQGGSFANNQFTSGAGAAGGNGFTTVPEPSTYALLAISAAAFGGYVIRRRNRK